jgi:hypothetical protein
MDEPRCALARSSAASIEATNLFSASRIITDEISPPSKCPLPRAVCMMLAPEEANRIRDSSLRSRMTQRASVAAFVVRSQNPHLPAALRPAAGPSRKVTGEVNSAPLRPPPEETSEQNGVLAILRLILGAGVTPAEGSVKPTAGFTSCRGCYTKFKRLILLSCAVAGRGEDCRRRGLRRL